VNCNIRPIGKPDWIYSITDTFLPRVFLTDKEYKEIIIIYMITPAVSRGYLFFGVLCCGEGDMAKELE
jgi:hypothetical protein